jgi:GTPase SAR1 family protein
VFLVFDVTKLSSFSNIRTWIGELREHADPNIVIMLVGNKTDLDFRVVSTEVAESFASAFSSLLRPLSL